MLRVLTIDVGPADVNDDDLDSWIRSAITAAFVLPVKESVKALTMRHPD